MVHLNTIIHIKYVQKQLKSYPNHEMKQLRTQIKPQTKDYKTRREMKCLRPIPAALDACVALL